MRFDRRMDADTRAVVEEGKRIGRVVTADRAVAFLFRYGVPSAVIVRLMAVSISPAQSARQRFDRCLSLAGSHAFSPQPPTGAWPADPASLRAVSMLRTEADE